MPPARTGRWRILSVAEENSEVKANFEDEDSIKRIR